VFASLAFVYVSSNHPGPLGLNQECLLGHGGNPLVPMLGWEGGSGPGLKKVQLTLFHLEDSWGPLMFAHEWDRDTHDLKCPGRGHHHCSGCHGDHSIDMHSLGWVPPCAFSCYGHSAHCLVVRLAFPPSHCLPHFQRKAS
jgi:hypothetical protein